MTIEIIIIAIFALAAMLAAILAIHNIRELSDTRSRYDAAKEMMSDLERQNGKLREKITVLERDLSVEITNSKMLERALLEPESSEIKFLHKVAQSVEGVRGAVRLFTNAYENERYDLAGLAEMAKAMSIDLKGVDLKNV